MHAPSHACADPARRVDVRVGGCRAQVLTAKPGQQPRRWIDWADLRGVFIKWGGYKLMAIRKGDAGAC